MPVADIHELGLRLSYYVQLATEGKSVLITDRGRIVACLRPPPASVDRAGAEWDALARLARTGRLTLGSGEPLSSTTTPQEIDVDLHRLLEETREDRIEPR